MRAPAVSSSTNGLITASTGSTSNTQPQNTASTGSTRRSIEPRNTSTSYEAASTTIRNAGTASTRSIEPWHHVSIAVPPVFPCCIPHNWRKNNFLANVLEATFLAGCGRRLRNQGANWALPEGNYISRVSLEEGSARIRVPRLLCPGGGGTLVCLGSDACNDGPAMREGACYVPRLDTPAIQVVSFADEIVVAYRRQRQGGPSGWLLCQTLAYRMVPKTPHVHDRRHHLQYKTDERGRCHDHSTQNKTESCQKTKTCCRTDRKNARLSPRTILMLLLCNVCKSITYVNTLHYYS